MKKVTILGSTGSIGSQSLDVIRENIDTFKVVCLTCGRRTDLLREQIKEFRPELAVTEREEDAASIAEEFPHLMTAFGEKGLICAAEYDSDIVLNALMGMRGLIPTVHAISSGRNVALANKETLVAGGMIVTEAVRRAGVGLLPVDSEHSAIFQCLQGSENKKIKRILLTESGGPFRGYSYDELRHVTPEMALRHPNWSMGRKITIDSATMMNKGLEMIEAKWLFGVSIDDIEVIVHPQSIIHSAVEFRDTAVIAQLGIPDMKIPISFALGYPDRLPYSGRGLDLFEISKLTFEKPDHKTFRCLDIASDAANAGGTYPAAMNGANEVLVQAFLDGKIGFNDIPETIERILNAHVSRGETLEDVLEADSETRRLSEEYIKKLQIKGIKTC